ncbi:hypothetical protein [Allorhizocola rhizosphaerae]|uniref:hypothetical protein n=1 Tax=Allorhizocola rhizosphaerae TaxID=1872709 RepID=UPI000E3E6806|nr:hypothetical protein [Allorhizocola rhizosphaerae]
MPRKPHRKIVGRLNDRLQQEREDSLRELQEAIHREQDERRQPDEEDYFDALDGLDDEDHPGQDDDPYAQ